MQVTSQGTSQTSQGTSQGTMQVTSQGTSQTSQGTSQTSNIIVVCMGPAGPLESIFNANPALQVGWRPPGPCDPIPEKSLKWKMCVDNITDENVYCNILNLVKDLQHTNRKCEVQLVGDGIRPEKEAEVARLRDIYDAEFNSNKRHLELLMLAMPKLKDVVLGAGGCDSLHNFIIPDSCRRTSYVTVPGQITFVLSKETKIYQELLQSGFLASRKLC